MMSEWEEEETRRNLHKVKVCKVIIIKSHAFFECVRCNVGSQVCKKIYKDKCILANIIIALLIISALALQSQRHKQFKLKMTMMTTNKAERVDLAHVHGGGDQINILCSALRVRFCNYYKIIIQTNFNFKRKLSQK